MLATPYMEITLQCNNDWNLTFAFFRKKPKKNPKIKEEDFCQIKKSQYVKFFKLYQMTYESTPLNIPTHVIKQDNTCPRLTNPQYKYIHTPPGSFHTLPGQKPNVSRTDSLNYVRSPKTLNCLQRAFIPMLTNTLVCVV